MLSLVAVSEGYSASWCADCSLQCPLWCSAQHTGSRAPGLQYLQCPRSVIVHRLNCSMACGCVPCIGRWILIHCTTTEVPQCTFEFWSICFFLMSTQYCFTNSIFIAIWWYKSVYSHCFATLRSFYFLWILFIVSSKILLWFSVKLNWFV